MDQDLIELLAAWRGEALDQARLDQLLARLRNDEAFQDEFVAEVRMLGMLKAVQSMEPRWLRVHDELGWDRHGRPHRGESEADDALIALWERAGIPARRRRFGHLPVVLAGMAALLLLGLGALIWRGHWHARRPHAGELAAAAEATPRAYPPVAVEDAVAMLVYVDGVAWEPGPDAHPAVGDLLRPGRLQFRAGRVTLSLLNGATLVIEGPADLDIIANDRLYCRRGKLRTHVPVDAEGLVISAPAGAVLDLGTEFGLNVDPSGPARVRVFEGRVEAMMRSGSNNQSVSHILRERSAVEIDPDAERIKPVDDAGEFLARIEPPRPALALGPAYARAIAAARPRHYWRMDRLEAGAVPNEVAGGPVLRAHGAVRIADTATGNPCAEFPEGKRPQYFVMDGRWQPPESGYAVELWFLPLAIDHSTLVSVPRPDTNHHALFLETGSRNRHALHRPASVRLLDRWPPGMNDGYNIYSRKPYVPYRWHHLVGQKKDGRAELYLDGEATVSTRDDLGHPSAPLQVLVGRLSTLPLDEKDPNSRWMRGRAFVGRIDEVVLYDHPLDEAQIQGHLRKGAARPVGP